MTRHYLKTAIRHLLRNPVYALVSIVGLAIAISCCLMINLYLQKELSYDNFQEKKDRIYRITTRLNFNEELNAALSSLAVGPTLMKDYPEVESYVRIRSAGQKIELSAGDRLLNEPNVWFTDSTIFDVFSYRLLTGDPQTALTAPNSLVISQELAARLFPNEDAMGQRVKANNSYLTVTGILEESPANSEFELNGLISLNTLPPQFHKVFNQDWFRISFYTFLLFKEEADIPAFKKKLIEFEKKYVQPWSEQNDLVASIRYDLTPLSKLHFDRGREHDLPRGNKAYLYIFGILAIFILIIASINYINMSLAKSTRRAREVGIRKTMGAMPRELAGQFLVESFIIACLGALLGLSLVELFIGPYNNLTGNQFSMQDVFSFQSLMILSGMLVLCGILAGAYPAWIMAGYRPVDTLKGIVPGQGGIGTLRKLLLFLQFAFSLFMILGTLLIDDQMSFLHSRALGFDKENIITISLPKDTSLGRFINPWKEELRNDSRIKSVSTSVLPGGAGTGELMFRIEQDGGMEERTVNVLFVDENFLDVLGLELMEGRNFSKDRPTDPQQAYIVNDYARKQFGWQDEAIGRRIQWDLEANGQARNDGQVVGVVKDFHFLSLHNPLEPMILCFNPNGNNVLTIKFAKGDYGQVLRDLESRWNEIAPAYPFEYQFFDETLNANYREEQRMHKLFLYFAMISLLIASLGLFALVSFTIETRVKEIGIRKVLGANLWQIIWVLTRSFFILLLIAYICVLPISLYLNYRWLEEFAYDVPTKATSLIMGLIIAGLLAALTLSYHSIRIARTKPVDTLRDE